MFSSPDSRCFNDMLVAVQSIASDIAAKHADDVDRQARFPSEVMGALKQAGVLSVGVPVALGGPGLTLAEQAELCAVLGAACSASGMVLAMHLIQLACLTRHVAEQPVLQSYLRELVAEQHLLASMTSEEGTFGDTRTSICAVHVHEGRFKLDKLATTGSYCAHADAILVTCRRHAEAAGSDQSLVLVKRENCTIEQTSTWDTLGMRGTCSPGFSLVSSGDAQQVLSCGYPIISAESMVPYSHVLWAALWWGIAKGTVGKAAAFVRNAARKSPGQSLPVARRLAEVVVDLQALELHWRQVAREVDVLDAMPEGRVSLHAMRWALTFNNLKIASSSQSQQIVHAACQIVGIAGYKNDSPYSMGRAYRDVLSSSMMIANDRILGKNADMLTVLKNI